VPNTHGLAPPEVPDVAASGAGGGRARRLQDARQRRRVRVRLGRRRFVQLVGD